MAGSGYTSPEAIKAYYGAMQKPVKAQIKQTKSDYQAQTKQLAQQKADADRQAYMSHQRQLRMMPDVASASGAHGGMVQSALAYQNAGYQRGRADRDVQLAQSQSSLLNSYNNALAQLRAQAAQYKGLADADLAELKYLQSKNGVSNLSGLY